MNGETFRSKVKSILSDNAGRRHTSGHTAGKLEAGKLGKLACGNARVFSRPNKSKYASYAVTLLLDVSGSMTHTSQRLPDATDAVVKLFHSLTYAGASVTVRPFNMRLFDPLDAVTLASAERLRKHAHSLATSRPANCGNHDGYAVEMCARELVARPEAGKVLIVLSDGLPSCDYADEFDGCRHATEDGKEYLVSRIAHARQLGVVTLGLGIETSHAEKFYGGRYSARIESSDQTFERVSVLLDRNIVRG